MSEPGITSMPPLQPSQVIDESSSEESTFCSWTRANTLILLDLCNKFRLKVGTLEIRNLKKMWEVMSKEFQTCHGIAVTASNCQNRWRVLERNYKKYINSKQQTGTGQKFFEFAEQMGNIVGKENDINPTVLLTAASRSKIPAGNAQSPHLQGAKSSGSNHESDNTLSPPAKKSKLKLTPMRPKYNSDEILEKFRNDKEQRHKEKFAFEKAKFEKLFQLELRKQAARETRNNFLKQSNELRKEQNHILDLLCKKIEQVPRCNGHM
ncbi:hypothetical protein HUJ04_002516 [Dendroctonus ponderosae]|uniref:Myb/SANT-like DNA-binding domain-containing protein n=2 Tax=Dendroctonus ponderosae TaxID=77166 RepID=A0AAR5PFM2_DENPD|nr:hypothetical protein HUJ04_002516 [Dendroctonus ponderosae]KAH1013533.1 hypothetical protein HUJ04_002516 [Dendroctonus ponderosae]